MIAFVLDRLPAHSGIEAELDGDRIRFVAVRLGPPRVESAWSGWFDRAAEPIMLEWRAFDFGEDATPPV